MFIRLVLAMFLGVTSFVLTGCGQDFGAKVVNNGTEIYFKGDITAAQAEKLGDFLTEAEFSDGTLKSVQLLKEDETWQFRMVTLPEFVDDVEMQGNFRFMCLQLSSCFDGENFQIHVCDDELKTLKVVGGHKGKMTQFDQTDVYHSNVSEKQMKKVGEFLSEYGFRENAATFYIQKLDDKVKFHMVANETALNDEAVLADCKALAKVLSATIFEGSIVEYHLCNEYMDSVNSVSAKADAQ